MYCKFEWDLLYKKEAGQVDAKQLCMLQSLSSRY